MGFFFRPAALKENSRSLAMLIFFALLLEKLNSLKAGNYLNSTT